MTATHLARALVVGMSLLPLASPARAQPKLPDPPKLPTTAEVPPLPLSPPAPPKASAPQPDEDRSSTGGALPTAPQASSVVIDGPAREVEIQIDDKPPTPSDGLPASLPKALRNSARSKDDGTHDQVTAGGLTIEEIVNPPVSSVSNSVEGALRAPAWTIILTRRELIDRGYTDLSQILDDLPGMDVVRTY